MGWCVYHWIQASPLSGLWAADISKASSKKPARHGERERERERQGRRRKEKKVRKMRELVGEWQLLAIGSPSHRPGDAENTQIATCSANLVRESVAYEQKPNGRPGGVCCDESGAALARTQYTGSVSAICDMIESKAKATKPMLSHESKTREGFQGRACQKPNQSKRVLPLKRPLERAREEPSVIKLMKRELSDRYSRQLMKPSAAVRQSLQILVMCVRVLLVSS